jgi:serine O-acetyltransferase
MRIQARLRLYSSHSLHLRRSRVAHCQTPACRLQGKWQASGTTGTMTVSAEEPDWSRESKALLEWAPSRSLLASIRMYQRHGGNGIVSRLMRAVAVMRHRFWSVVTGADIPVNARIGGGLLLPHPNGVVVHPDSEIGPNCLLFQQVTLGASHGGVPRLGGHVDVGAGAKIIGSVTIGDHARIGANAVVLQDVPPGATAVGIPARIIASDPM